MKIIIKRTFILAWILIILIMSDISIFAQSFPGIDDHNQPINDPVSQNAAQALDAYHNANTVSGKISAGKDYGFIEIDQRLDDIHETQGLINQTGWLSDQDRTDIQVQLNNSKNSLNDLRITIEKETNLEILKNNIEKIFIEYRIYEIILPKSRGMHAAGILRYFLNYKQVYTKELMQDIIKTFTTAQKNTKTLNDLYEKINQSASLLELSANQAYTAFNEVRVEEDLANSIFLLQDGKLKTTQAQQEAQTIHKLETQFIQAALNTD